MKYFVRYGEIGIKSPKIRRKFENKLMNNIKTELNCTFENDQGRITLITEEKEEKVHDVLGRVFGIVSYSPVLETKTDKEDIKALLKDIVPKLIESGKFNPEKDSFAIKCRRVGKHDFTSQEMAGYCGAVVVELTSAKVNLSNPDFTIYVEVRNDDTYIYTEKIPGLGGLPVGSQGRVVCLISGGIDSPVAAYLMLKRGCSVTLLHCDNYPFTTGTIDKVKKQAENLQRYSLGSEVRLYKVKLGQYLEHARNDAPPRMTCVLCKSGMYQTAEHLAKIENANAIADGSSIGQVASQTLNNIEATRYQCRMPIFSPLISLDKIEIENIGKKIGSYEVSIIPDSGCGAVPRYPETHADLNLVNQIIEDIDQKSLLNDVYETITKVEY
ncbi:tRNA 4-thiouridine(8) synthase ThiI [Methanosphaera sp. Vir-13MRS]|uniref:tRNA uracil 4-sulfurtransferase ThiI n=1 Tax=Candidatus Methanosphaera massiliense TaxID=3017187 RepID=UPI00237FE406|nr:tRNA uracil 4-sulfurtransferase ThiI [Candidatus Methanosphaera massiliense]MDE4078125.1 tRNA 4-thiouridine(8) synthase ThiI [Candidatus Methanosphaera massiliense]